MENIYWTWNKHQNRTKSWPVKISNWLMKRWMNVGYILSNTHTIDFPYMYFKVCSKGTIFCLSLWSFMSLIWWDCYLAELRPGLFSGGELSLVLLYFPQGLMGICFPSTWHHLHPKYFLGIISSVVKFGFKTFYWGLDFPLSLQSIRSVLSVRWIQVYPWFFWLVMKKHQVYVTIKLPPRSKPNRGITSREIIWFDDWAGFTKIHQKMCHVWDVFCNKCPPSLIMIRYANIMMKNHCFLRHGDTDWLRLSGKETRQLSEEVSLAPSSIMNCWTKLVISMNAALKPLSDNLRDGALSSSVTLLCG